MVTIEIDTAVADVAAYIAEHPEFLMCREYGHAMRPTHKGWNVKSSGVGRTMEKTHKCRDCGTGRVDEFSCVTYDLVRRHYEYPEGYTLVGATMSRHDVRQWDIEQANAAAKAVAAAAKKTPPRQRSPRAKR